ncbi:MAG TPA: hypothetical protein VJH22_00575 [Candidatus Nanoarchaeia archaeon]|nr:hypothetical protein [Candidatus Nanoarchaeia archaeon]
MDQVPHNYDDEREAWLNQGANQSFARWDAIHGNPLVPLASMVAGIFLGRSLGYAEMPSMAIALPALIHVCYEGLTAPTRHANTHVQRQHRLEQQIRQEEQSGWSERGANNLQRLRGDLRSLREYHRLSPQEQMLHSAVEGIKMSAFFYAGGVLGSLVLYGPGMLGSALERLLK